MFEPDAGHAVDSPSGLPHSKCVHRLPISARDQPARTCRTLGRFLLPVRRSRLRRGRAALLDSVLPGAPDPRVRDQIVAETRGNPLALLELPRGFDRAGTGGGVGLAGAIPLDGAGLQRRLELRARPRGCSAKPLTLPARQPVQALSACPRPGATGALVGALLPVLDVAVIAAFNPSYCLPIPGESPGPPNLNSGARYHEHPSSHTQSRLRAGKSAPIISLMR